MNRKTKIIKAPKIKERKIVSRVKELRKKKTAAKEIKKGAETLERDIFEAEEHHARAFEDMEEFAEGSAGALMKPMHGRPAPLEVVAKTAPSKAEEEPEEGFKYAGKEACAKYGAGAGISGKYGAGAAVSEKYGAAKAGYEIKKREAEAGEPAGEHLMPGFEPGMTGFKRQEELEAKYIAGQRIEEQHGIHEHIAEAGKSELEKQQEKYRKRLEGQNI